MVEFNFTHYNAVDTLIELAPDKFIKALEIIHSYKMKESLGLADELMSANIRIDIERELGCSQPLASVLSDVVQWAYAHEYRHCADDRVYESKRTL